MQNVEPDSNIAVTYFKSMADFAGMADAFLLSDKHTEDEIRGFVRSMNFYIERLNERITDGPRETAQSIVSKVLDAIPPTYFSVVQLSRMYTFIGQKERAAEITAEYLSRLEKNEVSYDGSVVYITEDWTPASEDNNLALRACLIYIDHMKYDPQNPFHIAWSFLQAGELAERGKDYSSAIKYYSRSVEEVREPGSISQQTIARGYSAIAKCYKRIGAFQRV